MKTVMLIFDFRRLISTENIRCLQNNIQFINNYGLGEIQITCTCNIQRVLNLLYGHHTALPSYFLSKNGNDLTRDNHQSTSPLNIYPACAKMAHLHVAIANSSVLLG